MDGSAAIEANRQALKRIVAMLVDMAGLAENTPVASPSKGAVERYTVPRILWRAILALLRPAESAARRLIIAAARGLVVPPVSPRKQKPRPIAPLLRKLGIAVMVARANASHAAILPRLRGSKTAQGGKGAPGLRIRPFPLFDPPRHLGPRNRHLVPSRTVPRILHPGLTGPVPLPPAPSPDDLVDATCLTRRLAALSAALDDLPGQARRFARLRASRDAASAVDPAAPHRIYPIHRSRPPGGRLLRYDPNAAHSARIREID